MVAAVGTVPRVRVVVLNWNGGDFIVRCMEHLIRTEWPADSLEIVVLDNDSSDGSDRIVAERFPQVSVLPTGANLGFVANNLALRDLGHVDYVALVNNDAFVDPGWLVPMVSALEADPELGAASAKIVFAPAFHEMRIESPTFSPPADGRDLGVRIREVATQGRSVFSLSQFVKGAWGAEPDEHGPPFRWLGADAVIRVAFTDVEAAADFGFIEVELAAEADKDVVLSCGLYRTTVRVGTEWRRHRIPHWQLPFDVINNAGGCVVADGFGADRGYLQVDDGRFDVPVDVFNWCGGGVLLRKQYLEHVGLLDERFFLYYEDTDLSWRGQALGWRYRYVPGSVLRHLHSASSGEGSFTFQFFVERNRLFALTKNAPPDLAWRSVIGAFTATVSYARRDMWPAIRSFRRPPVEHVRRRLLSLRSFLKWLPAMLVSRREIDARRVVSHDVLRGRLTPRSSWTDDEQTVVSLAGWSIGAEPFHTPGSCRTGEADRFSSGDQVGLGRGGHLKAPASGPTMPLDSVPAMEDA